MYFLINRVYCIIYLLLIIGFTALGPSTLLGATKVSLQEKPEKAFSSAWFPGPSGVWWLTSGETGLKAAIKNSHISILVNQNGDTGSSAQGKLGLKNRVKIISYYYSPGVHRGIRRGDILAAPTDHPVIQARIAADTIIRVLEKQMYFKHLTPRINVIN